ncbi:MAG: radical SAM protein [Candidatus Helarchaeota archaeon]
MAAINTCRGPCHFSCKHCIGNKKTYISSNLSPRKTLSAHSPEWIIAQLEYLLRDVSKIAIQDYIYCKPKILLQYAVEIQKHPILRDKIQHFNLAVLPGSLSRGTLRELSLAGVDSIDFGVETGSDKLLAILNRPYTKEDVLKSITDSCENGIRPLTYWMVGLPNETPDDLQETKNFLLKTIERGGIPRWVTPLCIFPSLELYEKASEHGLIPRFRTFEEYMIFSETTFSSRGAYQDTITHEMIIHHSTVRSDSASPRSISRNLW